MKRSNLLLTTLLIAIMLISQSVLADVLNVPSDGTHVQSQPLLADVQYAIEASGTFYFNGPPPSAWITDAAWGTWPSPAVWLEFGPLWIDNQTVDWFGTSDGEHFYPHTFSPTHVYRYYMLGTGQPVDFFIYDWPYSDNYGSLQVRVLSTLGEPVVNAGLDQTITLPAIANLDGTVTDDGLPNPPGAVTTQWTVQSGPGTVTFGNANDVDTTASFSLPGTYVLRLTANDGEFSNYDESTVIAEVLHVPSDGTHVQSQPLLADVQYVIEASGTFYFNGSPPSAWIADAAWSTWPSPPAWLEYGCLWIDNQTVDWLGTSDGKHFYPHTFSPTHVYQYYMLGTGQPVDFFIYDSLYSDNYGSLQVTLTPIPKLNEVSSTETTLAETVHTERWLLEDGNVVGDLNGTFDFNSFDIVLIKTGSWASKGFSKAQCQTILEGITYAGEWQGVAFFKPDDANTIYLNGSITGEILATVEGTLTESVTGSSVYDQYQATWKIGRLGNVTTSVTVNATGTLVDKNSSEYPATGLYVLQTAMDGNLAGDYNSPLNTVINHVRIADSNNPYDGNGFSIISYISQNGSGQGYSCDQLLPSGVVKMNGLFTDPLYGVLSASLNEKTTPRVLYLSLQRIDLGLPPMADLEVKTWGPTRVSPGQTIDYIVEYRNDGLKEAKDFEIVMNLPLSVNYISNTGGGKYNNESHEVVWHFDNLSPKDKGCLSVKETVIWGLAQGDLLDHIVSTPIEITEVQIDPNVTYEILQATEQPIEVTANIHNGLNSGIFSMSATLTEVNEHIQPILDYVETVDEIQIMWRFTVDGHSIDELIVDVKCAKNAGEWLKTAKEVYEANKTVKENQEWLGWLLNKQLISQEAYKNYSDLNQSRPYTALIPTLLEQISSFFTGVLSGYVTVGREATYRGADSYLWLSHIKWNLQYAIERGDIPEGVNMYDKLKEYYRQETSHSIDSHESEVSTARDPSVKYGPEGNVLPGQKLNYRVEYENEGEGIAFGVYFTDTLNKDLNDATLEIGPIIDVNTGLEIAPPGIYNPATRTITWFAGEVGPGQGGYSDVNVCVRSDANDGTEIINYATIYFPSVPEETRTNGIVSIVSLNQPPVAEAGDNRTAFVGANCIAEVTLDGSGSSDPDGDDLTYTWFSDGQVIATGVSPTVELSLGQHTIVLVVNDGKEESEPDEVMITVQDIIPPEFVLSVTPNVLWPPNHKMVQVTPTRTATDNCDKSPTISLVKITMNEGDVTNTFDPVYDVNVVDGRTAGDIQIASDGSIYLRAERAGSGLGRLYTITYKAVDDSGNATIKSAIVTVPHDQR